jgi:hypothetical protein
MGQLHTYFTLHRTSVYFSQVSFWELAHQHIFYCLTTQRIFSHLSVASLLSITFSLSHLSTGWPILLALPCSTRPTVYPARPTACLLMGTAYPLHPAAYHTCPSANVARPLSCSTRPTACPTRSTVNATNYAVNQPPKTMFQALLLTQ